MFCLPCDDGEAPATLEVVTTAAVGANIGIDPWGDPLGQSGMLVRQCPETAKALSTVSCEHAALVEHERALAKYSC